MFLFFAFIAMFLGSWQWAVILIGLYLALEKD